MVNSQTKICVFTGSRSGLRPEYAEAARQLGRELVARGYGLVYGGGKVERTQLGHKTFEFGQPT